MIRRLKKLCMRRTFAGARDVVSLKKKILVGVRSYTYGHYLWVSLRPVCGRGNRYIL